MLWFDQVWRLFCRHPTRMMVGRDFSWNIVGADVDPATAELAGHGWNYWECGHCGARLRERITEKDLPMGSVEQMRKIMVDTAVRARRKDITP